MGGSESKRRVVVEDIGGDAVVTLTEDVVRRIKGLPDEAPKDKKAKTDNKPVSPPPPIPDPSPPIRRSPSPQSKEVDKQEASRLKDFEDFYTVKLADLQQRNAALQRQTNEHFAKAVKEVENKFMNFTASPVCQDLQMKVLECYQANPREALNCSGIVNAFTSCVDRARMVMKHLEGKSKAAEETENGLLRYRLHRPIE